MPGRKEGREGITATRLFWGPLNHTKTHEKYKATDHTDLHGLTFPIIRSCLIICKQKSVQIRVTCLPAKAGPWPAFLYSFVCIRVLSWLPLFAAGKKKAVTDTGTAFSILFNPYLGAVGGIFSFSLAATSASISSPSGATRKASLLNTWVYPFSLATTLIAS